MLWPSMATALASTFSGSVIFSTATLGTSSTSPFRKRMRSASRSMCIISSMAVRL